MAAVDDVDNVGAEDGVVFLGAGFKKTLFEVVDELPLVDEAAAPFGAGFFEAAGREDFDSAAAAAAAAVVEAPSAAAVVVVLVWLATSSKSELGSVITSRD